MIKIKIKNGIPVTILKKINPERTIHNLEKIKIRANWIIRENI